MIELLTIIAGTFASEDLTCITVGLQMRQGVLDPVIGLAGCYVGILAGDFGLWLIGRTLGTRALRWPPIQRRLPEERLDRLALWFDRRGWSAVMAARFLPGTRFPIYLAAGILGRSAGKFLLLAALAGLIWTPLLIGLVVLCGETIRQPLELFLGRGWIALIAAAMLLFFAIRILTLVPTERGRAMLIARLARLWRWEFWPTWIFYLPMVPWIIWLALRHRSLMAPTAANPAMPHSGIVGESKIDILNSLPREWIAPAALIPVNQPALRLSTLRENMARLGLDYPVILKPNAAERGAGLRLAHHDEQALQALDNTVPMIVQAYHPGPYEAGIFYYRMPGVPRGVILSITDKHFPFVTGDGISTLEHLIWRHPRYRMQAQRFLKRLGPQADRVPQHAERVRLAIAGNHCQGTLFRDGAHLISPELQSTVEEIAQQYKGFYFGRFDVRYENVGEFRAGRCFTIIELNGATSESTNIYDPTWSLWRAYRQLAQQWQLLFAIGAANMRDGAPITSVSELLKHIQQYYRARSIESLAD